MIVGVGIDIQSVEEVEESFGQHGDNWLTVVLTEAEISQIKTQKKTIQSVAARIAAKEAAMKAIASGLTEEVDWLDFEVRSADSGQPTLVVTGAPKRIMDERLVTHIWLSLSHTPKYAAAQVILESRKGSGL